MSRRFRVVPARFQRTVVAQSCNFLRIACYSRCPEPPITLPTCGSPLMGLEFGFGCGKLSSKSIQCNPCNPLTIALAKARCPMQLHFWRKRRESLEIFFGKCDNVDHLGRLGGFLLQLKGWSGRTEDRVQRPGRQERQETGWSLMPQKQLLSNCLGSILYNALLNLDLHENRKGMEEVPESGFPGKILEAIQLRLAAIWTVETTSTHRGVSCSLSDFLVGRSFSTKSRGFKTWLANLMKKKRFVREVGAKR